MGKDYSIFENAVVQELRIKSDGIDLTLKDLPYEEGYQIVKDLVEQHPEDEFLKECWAEGSKDRFGFYGCSKGRNYNWSIDVRARRIKGEEIHYCPRGPGKDLVFQAPFNGEATWDKVGNDRVCSYCGSMHPDDFIELARKGFGAIESTDKRYKFYIRNKDVPNAGFGAIKFYVHHLTQDQIKEYNSLIVQRSLR